MIASSDHCVSVEAERPVSRLRFAFSEVLTRSLHGWFLAFLLLVGSPPPAAAAEPVTLPVTLLVLGDSLSAAYGLHINDGWVSLLEQRLREQRDRNLGSGPNVRVVNASISGETTAAGLERLPALLAEHQPDAVVIALGANDGLRGFALADIEDRLVRLVETARAADANVLLLGVRLPPNYGVVYSEGFQQLYAAVAKRTGVALVPRMLEGVSERWDLMQSDGLHPTAVAQPLILDHLWPAVAALLRGAAGQSVPEGMSGTRRDTARGAAGPAESEHALSIPTGDSPNASGN